MAPTRTRTLDQPCPRCGASLVLVESGVMAEEFARADSVTAGTPILPKRLSLDRDRLRRHLSSATGNGSPRPRKAQAAAGGVVLGSRVELDRAAALQCGPVPGPMGIGPMTYQGGADKA
jgi:hypothetical protein